MNEAETRAEHSNPAFQAAGWGVVEGSKILREHPIAPGRIEAHDLPRHPPAVVFPDWLGILACQTCIPVHFSHT
jgi:hypothetical protein